MGPSQHNSLALAEEETFAAEYAMTTDGGEKVGEESTHGEDVRGDEAMTSTAGGGVHMNGTSAATAEVSRPTATPLRNNYAAPNTPIASAKRPRGAPASSSSKVRTTPRVPPQPQTQQQREESDEAAVANYQSPLRAPADTDTENDVGGAATPKANSTDNAAPTAVKTDVTCMSPMHPPRPVPSRVGAEETKEETKEEVAEKREDEGSTSGWMGRKVDAIFSPVLSFLNGTSKGEEEAQSPSESQENAAACESIASKSDDAASYDADGDVTMASEDASTDEGHNPTPGTGSVLRYHHNRQRHSDEEASPESDDAKPAELRPDSNLDDEDHAVDEVEIDESDEAEDDEEEFNPYLFIKSLPSYRSVVSDPRAKICLPPKAPNDPPVSLVLDLDETLVHCTVEPTPDADMVFPVIFNGMEYRVHVRTRPHLDEFLRMVSEQFEVIVFTASQRVYADELLDRIDPEGRYIKHRMFRESCLPVEGNYLKDLNVLGRDLRKAVLVDNSPHAFGYQIDNGIPIESWFDDPNDTELLKLERFLRTLHGVDDVREKVRAKFQTFKLVREA